MSESFLSLDESNCEDLMIFLCRPAEPGGKIGVSGRLGQKRLCKRKAKIISSFPYLHEHRKSLIDHFSI
jgi:hypothetical protein